MMKSFSCCPGEFCPTFLLPLARRSESASGFGRRSAPGRLHQQRVGRKPIQTVSTFATPGVEQEGLPVAVPSGHAKAAIALSRRKPARSKLPAAQRWKERRLPKVCWGRKLPRNVGSITHVSDQKNQPIRRSAKSANGTKPASRSGSGRYMLSACRPRRRRTGSWAAWREAPWQQRSRTRGMSCALPLSGRAWVFGTSRSKMRRAESLSLRSSR
jgi:hypothetical protein